MNTREATHERDDLLLAAISMNGEVVEDEVDAEIARVVPAAFSVDSIDAASWLVRKVLEARAYSVRVKSWAEHEQRRAAREEQRLMYLFGAQLCQFVEQEIAKFNGRRRSL